MARAYYGSRISPNQTKTPEGYLVCHNVPIGKAGWLEYMPHELGALNIQGNDPVQVDRREDEVFNPAAIASFEGKPVTDEHPPDWISPSNVNAYMKGVTTNVRRGTDSEDDLLLADLIIYDPTLISEIQTGKREVSGGYDYDCEPLEDGKYAQKNIRGNHVAIVRSGRAGPRVAVKDSKPKNERGTKMKSNSRETIWGKMFKAYAQDAEPEELAEASKLMHEKKEGEDAEPPCVKPVAGKDGEPPQDHSEAAEGAIFKEILEAIKVMQADIAELKSAKAAPEPAKDALTSLEEELGGGEQPYAEGEIEGNVHEVDPLTNDESVTIDPELLAADGEPQVIKLPKTSAVDNAAAVRMAIKAAKPVVGAIKDPADRKRAQDALAKSFREQLKAAPSDAYKKMATPPKPSAKAQDSKSIKEEEERAIGENWKKKYNPHYKENK